MKKRGKRCTLDPAAQVIQPMNFRADDDDGYGDDNHDIVVKVAVSVKMVVKKLEVV